MIDVRSAALSRTRRAMASNSASAASAGEGKPHKNRALVRRRLAADERSPGTKASNWLSRSSVIFAMPSGIDAANQ